MEPRVALLEEEQSEAEGEEAEEEELWVRGCSSLLVRLYWSSLAPSCSSLLFWMFSGPFWLKVSLFYFYSPSNWLHKYV